MQEYSEENIRLIFGLKLNQLRTERRLSPQELSQKAGLSVSYLNEIEKGKKYPKQDKILALASALDVSYDQLVSLRLTKNLSPITQLLASDFIKEIPFDTFGIEKQKLLEMIARAPLKVSAFISTILEIARNYNLKTEHFYFAALRSYQEMHDNYFEEYEEEAERFRQEYQLTQNPITNDDLLSLLSQTFKVKVEQKDFSGFEYLKSFRVITLPASQPSHMLINQALNEQQAAFYYAREIAFHYLAITDRPYTASWLKVQSFETLLNNFRASYFAGCVLIPKAKLIEDLEAFFKQETWDPEAFIKLSKNYNASLEMFLHRLTNILPKYFGINQLFFIRYSQDTQSESGRVLTKELHLARSSGRFNMNVSEHLYRRYLTNRVLSYLEKKRINQNYLATAIRTRYHEKGSEYFCISILNPPSELSNNDHSLNIGFVITDAIKNKISFLKDSNIYYLKPEEEFLNRISAPEEILLQMQRKATEEELDSLYKSFSPK